MIELDDVDRELLLKFNTLYNNYETEVKVQMVIKTPGSTLTLFHTKQPLVKNINKQCKAIRAFMKEHKDD